MTPARTRPAPATLYGAWNYARATQPFAYDDTDGYRIAGAWVSGRGQVEDWGCGTTWMRRYITGGPYVGIDGAWSRFAEVQADLRTYRSSTPCAVMRGVLEHNWDWRTIAENFTDAWTDRAALVLFIPPQLTDIDLARPSAPVPDLGICGPDLMRILSRHGTRIDYIQIDHLPGAIQYDFEGVLLMERP